MTKKMDMPKEFYYKSRFFNWDETTHLDYDFTGFENCSNQLVKDAKLFIYKNACENIRIQDVCKYIDISEAYFIRLFKNETNTTPHSFIMKVKVQKAKELLLEGLEISQVAYKMGFSDQSHLNRVFKKYALTTPNEYKMLYVSNKTTTKY